MSQVGSIHFGRSTPAPYPAVGLAAFKLPWGVAPLEGKYYGTEVLNCDREVVLAFWNHNTHWDANAAPDVPSQRQKEYWGEGSYDECMVDTHWESQVDFEAAERLVDTMNDRGGFA